jgi:hypothetical protein
MSPWLLLVLSEEDLDAVGGSQFGEAGRVWADGPGAAGCGLAGLQQRRLLKAFAQCERRWRLPVRSCRLGGRVSKRRGGLLAS